MITYDYMWNTTYEVYSIYNKEVAALQKSLGSCPTFLPWDVEMRPCTSVLAASQLLYRIAVSPVDNFH